jgi:hypothetical protein
MYSAKLAQESHMASSIFNMPFWWTRVTMEPYWSAKQSIALMSYFNFLACNNFGLAAVLAYMDDHLVEVQLIIRIFISKEFVFVWAVQ